MSAYAIEAWGIAPNKSAVAYAAGVSLPTGTTPKLTTYWQGIPTQSIFGPTSLNQSAVTVFFATADVGFCVTTYTPVQDIFGNTSYYFTVLPCSTFPKTDASGAATLQVLNLQVAGSSNTRAGTVPSALFRVQNAPPDSVAWFRLTQVTPGSSLQTLPASVFDPAKPWDGNSNIRGPSVVQNVVPSLMVRAIPVLVSSVVLTPSNVDLAKRGSSAVITATVTPAVNSNSTLIWVASDPGVVSVTPSADTLSATVKSLQPGYVDVTAISPANPVATASVKVASNIVHVTDVAVSPTNIKIPLGALPVTYTAAITPDEAFDQSVTWSVSPSDVADLEVNESGAHLTFTTADAATVTITATAKDGGVSGSTTATQTIPVQNVDITPTNIQVPANSKPIVLTATLTPAGATNKTITWTVDKPDVATVTPSEDMMTAAVTFANTKAAKVVVSATTDDGGYEATAIVEQVIPATAVTIMPPGEVHFADVRATPFQLKATVAPPDAFISTPTWSVTPDGIVTVSPTGLVTPVAPGTATITASAGDVKATVTVSVEKPILGLSKSVWIGIGVGAGVVIIAIVVAILVVALRSKPKP